MPSMPHLFQAYQTRRLLSVFLAKFFGRKHTSISIIINNIWNVTALKRDSNGAGLRLIQELGGCPLGNLANPKPTNIKNILHIINWILIKPHLVCSTSKHIIIRERLLLFHYQRPFIPRLQRQRSNTVPAYVINPE